MCAARRAGVYLRQPALALSPSRRRHHRPWEVRAGPTPSCPPPAALPPDTRCNPHSAYAPRLSYAPDTQATSTTTPAQPTHSGSRSVSVIIIIVSMDGGAARPRERLDVPAVPALGALRALPGSYCMAVRLCVLVCCAPTYRLPPCASRAAERRLAGLTQQQLLQRPGIGPVQQSAGKGALCASRRCAGRGGPVGMLPCPPTQCTPGPCPWVALLKAVCVRVGLSCASAVLARLNAFLPTLASANQRLEQDMQVGCQLLNTWVVGGGVGGAQSVLFGRPSVMRFMCRWRALDMGGGGAARPIRPVA